MQAKKYVKYKVVKKELEASYYAVELLEEIDNNIALLNRLDAKDLEQWDCYIDSILLKMQQLRRRG